MLSGQERILKNDALTKVSVCISLSPSHAGEREWSRNWRGKQFGERGVNTSDTSRKGGECEADKGWEMQFPDGRTLADTFAVSKADLVARV